MLTREELQEEIIKLRPWAHEILLPHGLVTARLFPYGLVTARPPYRDEKYPGEKNEKEYTEWPKFTRMNEAGAFDGFKPPAQVLDIGCNSGWFSVHFAQQGFVVTAMDNKPLAIRQLELVKSVYGLNNLEIICVDVTQVLHLRYYYSLILVLGLIHHLDEDFRPKLLSMCHEALFPGGAVVIETKPEIPCQELLEMAGFKARRLKTKKGRPSWRGDKTG